MRKLYITYMQEELSYPVKAGQIKSAHQFFTVSASKEQRATLAARFGLAAIARLEGRFTLHHERSSIIAAALAMNAAVTQTCVVTLEPFEVTIQETAELRFVPRVATPNAPGDDSPEEDITPDRLDSPDEIPYENDVLDLGAALAEQLALSLDPYPRKPLAALPASATDGSANPFAALAAKFGKPGSA